MTTPTPVTATTDTSIKAIDSSSVHRITSGQVVVDLQSAVKELVENSLDAGATNIEVRFKEYGLKSIEVIDNGSGIAPEDYDSVALNHHTSKLSTFSALSTVLTFGFRGEALSSLCAVCESVAVVTATENEKPMGCKLEMDRRGQVTGKSRVARQRGTTLTLTNIFLPLPVRRKELERNARREFGKALNLLNAYALVPCTKENRGVRFNVSNQSDGGKKTIQLHTNGAPSIKASVLALWGPKAMDNIVEVDLNFEIEPEKSVLRRLGKDHSHNTEVQVKGLVSKFAVGSGRTGTDRQFLYINGRPCSLPKVQKAFNETYRSFNANQSPFIVADFCIPTETCDINVSPDKRTIFIHSEGSFLAAFKNALEENFSPLRATYDIGTTRTQSKAPQKPSQVQNAKEKEASNNGEEQEVDPVGSPSGQQDIETLGPRPESPISDQMMTRERNTPVCSESQPTKTTSTPSQSSPVLPPATVGHRSDRMDVDADTPLDYLGISPSPAAGSGEVQPPSSSSLARAIPSVDPENNDTTTERGNALSTTRLPVSTRQASVLLSAPTSMPKPSKETQPLVQMVLSTKGASWNLQCDTEECSEPPRKKRRSDIDMIAPDDISIVTRDDTDAPRAKEKGTAIAKDRKDATVSLRSSILSFAKNGSLVKVGGGGSKGNGVSDCREERRPTRSRAKVIEEDNMEVDELSESSDDRIDTSNGDTRQYLKSSDQGLGSRLRMPSAVIDLTDNRSDGLSMFDSEVTLATTHSKSSPEESTSRPEIIRTSGGENVSLRPDLLRISDTWRLLQERSATRLQQPNSLNPRPSISGDAGLANTDDGKAADVLSRVIDKEDFGKMEVVGQFNKGFIITRRRERYDSDDSEHSGQRMDDLFIIDQHAADEKYNFETLQLTTNIQSQKLIRPQPLELTAADELLAIDNMDILHRNGFEIVVDELAETGQGHKLQLVAQPVSKSTVFDMKDLEELINLMQDRPQGQMVRCSKARAMFAMRACRKSVMVGMPLTRGQMTSVVRHMGTMDQPWNCPHGRPTMRHLSDIANVGKTVERNIDWAEFGPVTI